MALFPPAGAAEASATYSVDQLSLVASLAERRPCGAAEPREGLELTINDDRRTTFDHASRRYLAARPNYPAELYDDLIAVTGVAPPASFLEVGCGPGTATLPLARRGFAITAVELGPALAARARANLAGFPGVTVITSAFEDWQPTSHEFDLVYAATAWHWVDPAIRYAKAAELLCRRGHLAVWAAGHAFPPGFDAFFTDIQRVYEDIGESHPGPWPPPPPDEAADAGADFEASGRFEVVGVRRYLWAVSYTADTYIELLDTFSGHIAMEAPKRELLYAEVRRLISARPDPRVTRHWSSVLTIGRAT